MKSRTSKTFDNHGVSTTETPFPSTPSPTQFSCSNVTPRPTPVTRVGARHAFNWRSVAVEDTFNDISSLSEDDLHDKVQSLVCFLCVRLSDSLAGRNKLRNERQR